MENIKCYSHLKELSSHECSNGKFVAKNIRKHLSKHFPNIKFSVRSEYSAVKINLPEPVDRDLLNEVKKRVDIFQSGYFDSMRDIYTYDESWFNKLYGGCKYIFVGCYSS